MFKKTLKGLLCLVFIVGLTGCDKSVPATTNEKPAVQAEQPSKNEIRRYGVKAGIIEYELTGTQTGKKTITWDDWGMKERTMTETTITAAGRSFTTKNTSIMMGEWIYSFDPEKKAGTKLKNTILTEIAQNADNPDLGEVGLDIIKNAGAKKIGTETVAGTSCDVYEITSLGTKTCVWKAVTLKVESKLAGVSVNETATNISTDTPSPDLFEIPSDVSFSELGDIRNLKNLGR